MLTKRTPTTQALEEADPLSEAEPVRLHHCPKCGYILSGTPRGTSCSECGQHQSADAFSIPGIRTVPIPFRWVTIIALLGAIAPTSDSLLSLLAGKAANPAKAVLVTLLGLLILTIFFAAHSLYLGQRRWLLFDPRGIRCDSARGEQWLDSWSSINRVRLEQIDPSGPTRRRCRIVLHRDRNTVVFAGPTSRELPQDFSLYFLATDAQASAIALAVRERFESLWGDPRAVAGE